MSSCPPCLASDCPLHDSCCGQLRTCCDQALALKLKCLKRSSCLTGGPARLPVCIPHTPPPPPPPSTPLPTCPQCSRSLGSNPVEVSRSLSNADAAAGRALDVACMRVLADPRAQLARRQQGRDGPAWGQGVVWPGLRGEQQTSASVPCNANMPDPGMQSTGTGQASGSACWQERQTWERGGRAAAAGGNGRNECLACRIWSKAGSKMETKALASIAPSSRCKASCSPPSRAPEAVRCRVSASIGRTGTTEPLP